MLFKKLFIIFLFTTFFFHVPAIAYEANSQADELIKTSEGMKQGQTNLGRWIIDNNSAQSLGSLNTSWGEQDYKSFFTQLETAYKTGGPMPKLAIGGAIGSGTQMIATLFKPPASGIEYIAQSWGNILGKPAYAQGFGFKGLEFLLPLWKGFRNLVYILSSIIFVIIGLMIILRVKISPQAVVTVQSAIPAVITTLILVTFSYAIAGLMIDAGNLISGIVISLIFNSQGVGLGSNLFKQYAPNSGFPIISDILSAIQNWINSAALPFQFSRLANPDIDTLNGLAFLAAPHWSSLMLLGTLLGAIITGLFFGSIGNIFGGFGTTILSVVGKGLGGAIGGLTGMLIIPIILSVIIGIWMIQLYFGLIKVYITIIFKIITGPLEIAMGAFPNSKVGFSSWLLDLFANIAVFPIITIVMIIINIIVQSVLSSSTNVWAPGLINSTDTLYPQILSACIGIGGLALISKLPDLIPQYIFMIKPSPFGDAIGKNLSGITNNPVTQVSGQLMMSSAEHYIRENGIPVPQFAKNLWTKVHKKQKTGGGAI